VTPGPPQAPCRIAYLGTPELAVDPLRALVAAGHEVAVVITSPDRRRGRGSATTPSPVSQAATEMGIAVSHQPDDLLDSGIDLGVVVAYGRLIRPHLLAVVPFVNLHVSLLPRWRGAAPIERAILAGDERTGVCLMAIEEGLDTGGVYASAEARIDRKTVQELRSELIGAGTRLLLDALAGGFGEPVPQVGPVTHAEKLTIEDRRIDPFGPGVQVDRVVRIGGAWTTVNGHRLKLHEVEPLRAASSASVAPERGRVGRLEQDDDGPMLVVADGVVRLVMVQPAGRAVMSGSDWWRGSGLASGTPVGQ